MNLYEQLDEWLLGNNSDCIPAEVHGLFCGMSALNENETFSEIFVKSLTEYADLDIFDFQINHPVLFSFLEYSSGKNKESEFHLELFLPDDDHPFYERVEALGSWCKGFLYGVQNTFKDEVETMRDSDCIQALDDIKAISELDTDSYNDSVESDFYVVAEHAKLSAGLIISELKQIERLPQND